MGYSLPSREGLSPQDASSLSATSEEQSCNDPSPPSQDGSFSSLVVLNGWSSSSLSDYLGSNIPSLSDDDHGKGEGAYMRLVEHSRYGGDSCFQFLDPESATLQHPSSSPPPQSSSPLPLSSPPSDDWWSTACLASNYLDPIQEEEDFQTDPIDAPPFSSTPDLSPDSSISNALHHSRFSISNNHPSGSSGSRSSTHARSDSPGGAHTDLDYDFDNTHQQNDEFTDRLHELLLAVARERGRERESEVVECNEDCFCRSIPYAYGDLTPDCIEALSSPYDARDYELNPQKNGMSLSSPRMMDGKYRMHARSPFPDRHALRSTTFTASPTLYSPSAVVSPLDRTSLSPEESKDSVTSDTEIDTLVFASPSCSPPARILKRLRSLSIDQTDIENLPSKHKLRKIGSSIFSSSTDFNNTPTPKASTSDQNPTVPYRIIKTPSTFLAQRKFQQSEDQVHPQNYDERPTKIPRIKSNHDTSSASRMGRNFATGPASLRRAASLRSDADDDVECKTPLLQVQADISLVPTVPSTPDTQVLPAHDHARRIRSHRLGRVLAQPLSPVPIIAPPTDHMPRFPLSDEASAKIRLERQLEREKRAREADGLEGCDGCGVERISKKIEEDCVSDDWGSEVTDDDDDVPHTSDDWELVLGVGESLRQKVLRWILEVLPVYTPTTRARPCSWRSSSCTSSCSSSCAVSSSSCFSSSSSSSSSSVSSTGTSPDPSTEFNLLDQLSTSPETRFHAAYMFLRYFYLVFGVCSCKNSEIKAEGLFQRQKVEERETADDQSGNGGGRLSKAPDGWELMTWDVGIACLALSVKYHRDFLYPLLPVYACEFQTLAPHFLSYEDLETSQRDVLATFSYSLGTTPQAFLDEIWVALPSLRQLFDYNGGWNCVTKETWWRLFEAVLEPDVLRFPISLLTAAALTDAIQASLVKKYEYEAKWNAEMARRRRPQRKLGPQHVVPVEAESKLRVKRERRAEWQAEGVVQDVQAVLRISDARLRECRQWLTDILD